MDVSNLKLDDIKWNKDQIIFKQTKTGKERIFNMIDPISTIELKKSILEDNDADAEKLRAHDDYSILSMVEQGLGISILTELVLNKTSYNVAAVPIEPPIIRTMSIVVKDKKSLSLASRKFIKCLLDSRSELT